MKCQAERPALRTERIPSPRGGTLAVDIIGAGPPLLFVHGISGRRTQWRNIASLLAHRATVIAPDLACYGASTVPPVADFADFAIDIAALVEALELGPVVAFGHSMGGRVVLETVARDAGLFRALVLSATEPAFLAHMSMAERYEAIARRLAMFDGDHVSAVEARMVSEMIIPPHHRDARRAFIEDITALHADGYYTALTASAGMDQTALLGTLTMPVTTFAGALDPVCPPQAAQAVAAAISQGPATILADVGHMPHLEVPERVTAIVAALLDRLEDPRVGGRVPAPMSQEARP
ncbi:hypothetical protein DLJ53_07075 [Acuticoccus sediminis]|uniref:AB hydrolase-1 domain-containing protein n=1 Tax=Acuticoccus sediminis TaxID=2184697 RepID=A0A8B2NZE8_9HYPH|nr:alpha/beta hydrolase [Acuticoccus sediminis]RAI04201.1 hypothetical protein DLJ53_07075 [Acuticoccus sediminis]